MVKNYWYIVAFSVVLAVVSIQLDHLFLLFIYFLWLLILQYRKKLSTMMTLLAIASFFLFYMYIPSIDERVTNKPSSFNQPIPLQGKITTPIDRTEKKIEFTLHDDRLNEKILILLFPREADDYTTMIPQVKMGATCEFIGELALPERATNPHQFDYQKYLLEQGITYQTIIPTDTNIVCTEGGVVQRFYEVRAKVKQSIQQNLNEFTV